MTKYDRVPVTLEGNIFLVPPVEMFDEFETEVGRGAFGDQTGVLMSADVYDPRQMLDAAVQSAVMFMFQKGVFVHTGSDQLEMLESIQRVGFLAAGMAAQMYDLSTLQAREAN